MYMSCYFFIPHSVNIGLLFFLRMNLINPSKPSVLSGSRDRRRLFLYAEYCSGDKIEKSEMGGACSAYGGEER